MRLELPGQPHLTYCTNIHAGETWSEIEAALVRHLPSIKQSVCPQKPVGVGLRLSAMAAEELAEPWVLNRFKRFLADGGYYVFTVNAFPYGPFHGERVKEKVYEPDWRMPERLAFTNRVADILAEIAPKGTTASISTVPGAFKARITTPADVAEIVDAIVRSAAYLHALSEKSGRTLVLALEPEPACFLETTDDAVRFLQDHVFATPARALFSELTGVSSENTDHALRRHVGLCFDVCHSAVEFEDTAAALESVLAAGISIAKLQLSSALRAVCASSEFERLLAKFDDGIYLHQTVEKRGGALTRHTDLPDAFAAARRGDAGGEWRIHCHVPVFIDTFEALGSTQQNLRDALALCRSREVSPHLEVETYTWNVLPGALKSPELTGDIIRELQWVRTELGA